MSEEFVLDDGRKAEKLEIEQNNSKVIEIYVEPKLEKKLKKRITEKFCVCEREIEEIDENTGEVVSKTIERVFDPTQTNEVKKSFLEMKIEEKLKNKKFSTLNIALTVFIVLQVLGLLYLLLK